MFGKNAVAPKRHEISDSLIIKEIFYTLQGEGPDAGRPAIFLRLAGCNLRCYFCDTDFENGRRLSNTAIIEALLLLSRHHSCKLVVITGGEPLIQNILPLVELLNMDDISVSVETAGTVYLPGLEDFFHRQGLYAGNLIVCSPKTPKIAPQVADIAYAFKYILNDRNIAESDGLPMLSTQREGLPAKIERPPTDLSLERIYVQAEDCQSEEQNHRNIIAAAKVCLRYGYRLSVQMHKIAELP